VLFTLPFVSYDTSQTQRLRTILAFENRECVRAQRCLKMSLGKCAVNIRRYGFTIIFRNQLNDRFIKMFGRDCG
jgi:RecA/RadA recombinase